MTANLGRAAFVAAIVVTALGLGACKRKTPPPPPSPTPSPLWSRVPSPTPVPSGPLFSVKGLDLCERTDLTLLGDMKVKAGKKKPNTTPADDASCFFELRTKAGREAWMLVSVDTLATVDDAKDAMRSHRQFRTKTSEMTYEGNQGGGGDELLRFSKETDKKDLERVEYLFVARYENRIVETWLEVFGKPLVSKADVADKALKVLDATALLAAKYKPGELP